MWVAILLEMKKGWRWVIQASDAVGKGSVLTWDRKATSLPSAFVVSVGLDAVVLTGHSLEFVPRLCG